MSNLLVTVFAAMLAPGSVAIFADGMSMKRGEMKKDDTQK
jgi:hypothetical protein